MSNQPGYVPGLTEVRITALRAGHVIYEWPALIDTSEAGRLAKLHQLLNEGWSDCDEITFTTPRDFWGYTREEMDA